ncbi:hypothetical protein Ocin01_15119 [Orchesella cincta]|uniref:Uncharacterized protein n=1 Tax=Orchesella cincta TaxID=48709 RepID=A0A1D2MEZ7_ORCCI|nr:hypothetical protein Ocin01_15119 [Orchesella cincta]
MKESSCTTIQISRKLFPLYPILQQIVFRDAFRVLSSSPVMPKQESLGWFSKWFRGLEPKEANLGKRKSLRTENQVANINIHNLQKIEDTRDDESNKCSTEELPASPPPPPPLPEDEPIIFISYDPEAQSRIQDSFCSLQSPFIPSYEHLSGTQAVVAELKQIQKRMRSKKKERGDDYDDDEEEAIIVPVARPRRSLLIKKEVDINSDNVNAPLPLPRGSKVA